MVIPSGKFDLPYCCRTFLKSFQHEEMYKKDEKAVESCDGHVLVIHRLWVAESVCRCYEVCVPISIKLRSVRDCLRQTHAMN